MDTIRDPSTQQKLEITDSDEEENEAGAYSITFDEEKTRILQQL